MFTNNTALFERTPRISPTTTDGALSETSRFLKNPTLPPALPLSVPSARQAGLLQDIPDLSRTALIRKRPRSLKSTLP